MDSSFEVESKACDLLIKEVNKSRSKGCKVIICTDSSWVQEDFLVRKAKDLSLFNFYITKCDRNLNEEAEYLAKRRTDNEL